MGNSQQYLLAKPVARRRARSNRLDGDDPAGDFVSAQGLSCVMQWRGMCLDSDTLKSRLPSVHRRGRTET